MWFPIFQEQVDTLSKKDRIKPSTKTTNAIISKIGIRELTKPNVRKLANRYTEFYRDSLCDPRRSDWCTVGGRMGEPATQAPREPSTSWSKVSFQGSIDRLIQILESLKESTASLTHKEMSKQSLAQEGTTEEDALKPNRLNPNCIRT